MANTDLITNSQRLLGASRHGYAIPVYDDGWGLLFVHRDSMGINGIVRAQTWEDAYSICEDEFFPEATETIEELRKEYAFKREHVKVIRSAVSIPAADRPKYLGAYEKIAEPADYSDNDKLPPGAFIRREIIETPSTDDWAIMDNELFQESYGIRPNGPNTRDKLGHGIYAKDLNGDYLDELTPKLCTELDIVLTIESDASDELEDE